MNASELQNVRKSRALPLLLVVVTGVGAAKAQSITEFPLPVGGSGPVGIAAGPDGSLWFTEGTGNRIGRLTTEGVITEFPLPAADRGPHAIVAGPDGNLWFTEPGNSIGSGYRIGRITPDGVITEFLLVIDHIPLEPRDIAAGSDGSLWFTAWGKIGRITTTGVVTAFQTSEVPFGIAAGPDGNLWFTEYGFTASDALVAKIGRITTAGVLTEFPIPNASASNGYPGRITAGPDGNVWFIEGTKVVGQITLTGVVTEFQLDTAGALSDIVAGPDDSLWLAARDRIVRITTAGVFSEFQIPRHFPYYTGAAGIAVGPDGNLWFTEASSNRIGRMAPTASTCVSSQQGLCLRGRFLATATYRNAHASGTATANGLSDSSGFFTFGDPDSVELVVKVLDACGLAPSTFWVFAAGLTNQETTLTVTDTKTGDHRNYFSALGTTFVTITDTGAFSTCP